MWKALYIFLYEITGIFLWNVKILIAQITNENETWDKKNAQNNLFFGFKATSTKKNALQIDAFPM